jgi:hypothetical protein
MSGDVLDALAIDPDFAPIPQTFQILLAGEGQCRFALLFRRSFG